MNTEIRNNRVAHLLAATLVCLLLASSPAAGRVETETRAAAPSFKVLAFYNGTWDAAHIDFVKEANRWFPQLAAQNGFSYTSTNDWNQLNASNLAQYQVVLFLDDLPQTSAQRAAFQQYMQGGGGWMGFHVSAFTTSPDSWSWYHHQFLGTGAFKSNTWGPTTAVLKVENRTHPSTLNLPATFTSAVSEWYGWSNNLRNNADIQVLASVDPVSFPLGTDPNQSWYSGDYPILWTNKKYKMLYANFGHNAMNYSNNTPLSSTFASEIQNRFILDGLKWLGGVGTTPPPPGPISPTAWYTATGKGAGKCVDARSAASANGTVVQQYACNGTLAQHFQFQPTSGGYVRINSRLNSAQVLDVKDVSAADGAQIQLWVYSNGNNQQWLPEEEASGSYHFVNRYSGKCLTATGSADSTPLVQSTCNGSTAQSFSLTVQP
ncbi:ThuA domain-containing protein [Stigmatella sp. ncwal1]|uniref:ThuA domain-containing protein n=1 Tax=Stigmatella ashevillensis TaxID=2995309 RepID=A0ABT5D036_9BACT|nr:ThuA domain-containing protein [Stigmatella ashevillena]MDC0707035.1 ThuA domain-containing protein [Stigmatella ashevillena]